MAYTIQAGRPVKYRDANGMLHHAICIAVTDQSTIDLRIAQAATHTDITRVEKNDGLGEGWLRIS